MAREAPRRVKPPCTNRTALFFSTARADVDTCRQLCQLCPLLEPCLTKGMDEDYGTWAGTTPEERRAMRRARRAAS